MLRHKKQVAVAVVASAAALTFALTALAGGLYKDATGDGKGAPDIQNVSATADPNGQIVLAVTADNFPRGADVLTLLGLDTDMNPATGSGGADYVFVVDHAARSFDFAHVNGGTLEDTPSSTVRVSLNASTLTISVNKSELGNTAALNLWVANIAGDPAAGQIDRAPDNGVWNFTLAANGPDVQSVSIQPTPALPTPGKAFGVSIVGLKIAGDTSTPVLKPDSYTCTATLGGKPLQSAAPDGCSWNVPKTVLKPKAKPNGKHKAKGTAKVKEHGMTLAVTVNVTYDGVTKPFPFTFLVN